MDKIGLKLPLPDVNPNMLSGLSVITSFIFLLTIKFSLMLSLVILLITLLLDWFDGIVARKFGHASEEGHMVDVASDRFSESLFFVAPAFFFPWFYLFTLNCALSLLSVKKKRHVILPLRHVFFVFCVFILLFGGR